MQLICNNDIWYIYMCVCDIYDISYIYIIYLINIHNYIINISYIYIVCNICIYIKDVIYIYCMLPPPFQISIISHLIPMGPHDLHVGPWAFSLARSSESKSSCSWKQGLLPKAPSDVGVFFRKKQKKQKPNRVFCGIPMVIMCMYIYILCVCNPLCLKVQDMFGYRKSTGSFNYWPVSVKIPGYVW
jgi:hypothetical protein